MGLVGTGRKGGGVVNVLDANTGQWATQVRVEGRGGVADFAWWGDGEGLVVIGRGGQAVEYGVREKRVLAHWTDDGAMGTTIIALGGQSAGGRGGGLGGNRWMAVGSDCGIVNVYDRSGWSRLNGVPEHPKPMRALDQLVTAITSLLVSPDGQLLVMASREKRDALRLGESVFC
jgi:U3 small nucleolar RNA-associated protein 18